MSGFGPSFGISWDIRPAPTMMPALNGSSAADARSGLYCRTICK